MIFKSSQCIFLHFREPSPACKTYLLIDDGKCDLINFNEVCSYDGKDCCPNYHGIGNGYCDSENIIKMCNYDGGDCCELEKINNGICEIGNLNRMCDLKGEWKNDCSCDYKNLTRDGHCNPANNKSNCLFDDYDCLCPDSSLVNGVYVNCTGNMTENFSLKALVMLFQSFFDWLDLRA